MLSRTPDITTLYYNSGVTPFQAGAQVGQAMCENNTKNKKK